MDYEAVLTQVLELLQWEKRLSYRVLKRRLGVDDDHGVANHRARAKHPDTVLYGIRIGYPTLGKNSPRTCLCPVPPNGACVPLPCQE